MTVGIILNAWTGLQRRTRTFHVGIAGSTKPWTFFLIPNTSLMGLKVFTGLFSGLAEKKLLTGGWPRGIYGSLSKPTAGPTVSGIFLSYIHIRA